MNYEYLNVYIVNFDGSCYAVSQYLDRLRTATILHVLMLFCDLSMTELFFQMFSPASMHSMGTLGLPLHYTQIHDIAVVVSLSGMIHCLASVKLIYTFYS